MMQTGQTGARTCRFAVGYPLQVHPLIRRPIPLPRTQVRRQRSLVRGDASSSLPPEVEQVKTAFDALQTAATGLTTENVRPTLCGPTRHGSKRQRSRSVAP
jgi:hypothetical protein